MKNKKIYVILLLIIVLIVMIVATVNINSGNKTKLVARPQEDTPSIQTDNEINTNIKNSQYVEDEIDKIALQITDNVVASNIEINKTGDTSYLRGSDAYGQNAGILVKSTDNDTINEERFEAETSDQFDIEKTEILDSNVLTNGLGASGIVVSRNANMIVKNTYVETRGERSRGILATNGGTATVDNATVVTYGYKSSGIATDLQGASIEVKNSKITTNNIDSPTIYSTGAIMVKDSTLISNQAECVVIDGNNAVNFENVTASSGKKRGITLYIILDHIYQIILTVHLQ